LLDGLGLAQSHSRPHLSDDNPYSESINKTLTYSPRFPNRFGSLEDGKRFCDEFFNWYNNEHRHSGISLLTPAMLHHGGAVHVPRRSTRRDARRVFCASRSIHRRQTAPTRRSAGRLDQSNIRHRHSSIDAHYVTQYSGTRSLDTFRVAVAPRGSY